MRVLLLLVVAFATCNKMNAADAPAFVTHHRRNAEADMFLETTVGSSCVTQYCSPEAHDCATQWSCVQAGVCNAHCELLKSGSQERCNLLCELNYGYNSTKYRALMQCMNKHGCLPHSDKPDGICLAQENQTVTNLTDVSQIFGKWWVVQGENCGQNATWPAGFDWFPCQSNAFSNPSGNQAIDHIAYCGGADNKCSTKMLNTFANVTVSSPGTLLHKYTDPPLTPQTEKWFVVAWPHPDWMLYVYCGSTPTGKYAGGAVVTRISRHEAKSSSMPAYVHAIFQAKAKELNFNLDTMCKSDDTIHACHT